MAAGSSSATGATSSSATRGTWVSTVAAAAEPEPIEDKSTGQLRQMYNNLGHSGGAGMGREALLRKLGEHQPIVDRERNATEKALMGVSFLRQAGKPQSLLDASYRGVGDFMKKWSMGGVGRKPWRRFLDRSAVSHCQHALSATDYKRHGDKLSKYKGIAHEVLLLVDGDESKLKEAADLWNVKYPGSTNLSTAVIAARKERRVNAGLPPALPRAKKRKRQKTGAAAGAGAGAGGTRGARGAATPAGGLPPIRGAIGGASSLPTSLDIISAPRQYSN